jgi:hypothetical protein
MRTIKYTPAGSRLLRPAGSRLLRPAGSRLLRPAGSRLLRPAGSRLLRPAGSRLLRPAGSRLLRPAGVQMWVAPTPRSNTLSAALLYLGASENNNLQSFPYTNRPLVWQDDRNPNDFHWCTWRAQSSELFTLFKAPSGHCCAYSHTLNQTFFVSHAGLLGRDCMSGTAVLAQYVEDHIPNYSDTLPRMLVFDILYLPDASGGNLVDSTSAEERYDLLRTDLTPTFTHWNGIGLTLQWAGEYRSCKNAIRTGAMQCPHEIAGILLLHHSTPWSLTLV